jgi:N-acetyltransferase
VTVDEVTLEGRVVRLEPLHADHAPGLAAAAAEARDTYGWTWVPDGEDAARTYVEEALAGREAGHMLPFATVRLDGPGGGERVVGSTRFCTMQTWTWRPDHHPSQRDGVPDVVEIGYTWLAASAQRTVVNTEAKLLMLGHAFDVWRVHRVALVTDHRNERSRRAIERLGASLDGVLRAERPGADGTVRDTAVYSIVAAEWPEVRAGLQGRLGR